MSEHLIDLDELILRCKDEEARKYITEAVACYKAGAFRACIVTTWIAVVYDFVHKLRQLELTGDKNAIAKLDEFEKAQKSNTPELALKFEKQILEWSRDDFEFLSPMQYGDLERLLEDRNRCAHPSMISAEEIYQPPAELARYHLRNAITHFLQHPPIQGQAALDRLKSDTLSQYFPTDTEKAIEYFRHGPLAHPKDVLVRNFAIALLKTLLTDEHDEASRSRFTAALNAVRQMYPSITERTLADQLSKTVQKLSDRDLGRAVLFMDEISDTYRFLENDARTRMENYIMRIDEEEVGVVLNTALNVADLRSKALERLNSISSHTLEALVAAKPRSEFIEIAIEHYGQSTSYNSANNRANTLILPLIKLMNTEHVVAILSTENDQVIGSFGLYDVLRTFVEVEIVSRAQIRDLLKKHNFSDNFYYEVFPDETPSDLNKDIPF